MVVQDEGLLATSPTALLMSQQISLIQVSMREGDGWLLAFASASCFWLRRHHYCCILLANVLHNFGTTFNFGSSCR